MFSQSFPLLPLEDTDLGIAAEPVYEAFRPFVADGGGEGRGGWARERAIRRTRVLRRLAGQAARRWLGLGRRDAEAVVSEYTEAWNAGHRRYDPARGAAKLTPWRWRQEPILADVAGAARFRSLLLGAAIDRLRPSTVLEVGCGDGINLLLLAGAYPDIVFTGLELTEAGHRAAVAMAERSKLPQHLRDYAPLPQKDRSAHRRITFVQGDATAMPFADGQFDLVFTVLSVEQMERVRGRALAEIVRVSGRHVLNLEPFRDVNRTFLRRANVFGRDYFRGSIAGLRRYGLEPLWATADFPQEEFLGAALVLSRKS